MSLLFNREREREFLRWIIPMGSDGSRECNRGHLPKLKKNFTRSCTIFINFIYISVKLHYFASLKSIISFLFSFFILTRSSGSVSAHRWKHIWIKLEHGSILVRSGGSNQWTFIIAKTLNTLHSSTSQSHWVYAFGGNRTAPCTTSEM